MSGNSGNPGDRDYPGIYGKYTPPTVANGKVYVADSWAQAPNTLIHKRENP
jgi:hypothetical protein